MSPATRTICCLLSVCAVMTASDRADAAPPKLIQPSEAFEHATREVTIEFVVRSSSQIKDRNDRDVVFLNSNKNYRDEDNFTVVIFSDGVARFRRAKIKAPARHFHEKKVRVTGKVELRRGKPQIILNDPDQIRIVKEDRETKPAA